MTPVWAKLSMQPESSDGFASVGTILPKEKAALLPGGLFACAGARECQIWGNVKLMEGCYLVDSRDVVEFRRGDRSMHDFFVALIFVALIMAPCLVAFKTKLNDVDSK